MKSQIQMNGEKVVKPKSMKKGPGLSIKIKSEKKNGNYLSKKISKLKKCLKNGDGVVGRHIATAGELKEFLKVRALPPEIASSSPTYHPCQGCFEIFRLANGLDDHMNRLSSQILFRCFRCNNKELSFFNRCSLITHLKWSHHISQPSIKDLRNCTKIQPLPGSYFKNYDHYNNLDNLEQQQDGEFSFESESISNILNSNASHIKTTLTFKTEDGNLFLIHEHESANNTTAPEQTSPCNDLPSPSSSPIISSATAITSTLTDNSFNSTFLSCSTTKPSSKSSSSDQDSVVSNKEMELEPMKSDEENEENDSKMILRNGESTKESKNDPGISDDSDSEKLEEVDDDNDMDMIFRKNGTTRKTRHSKFRHRPSPERKQPSRSTASNSSLNLNRLTRSSISSNKKLTKMDKVRSSDYKACVHCSIPIPIKSMNRHESSCDQNPNSSSYKKFCFSCKKNIKLNQPLYKHGIEEHLMTGEKICLFCNNQKYDQANIEKHLEIKHFSIKPDTIFPQDCPLCQEKLIDMDKLKEHYKSHHDFSGDHCCSDCSLNFPTIKMLLLHKSYSHMNENNMVSEIFCCSYCLKHFRSIIKIKRHLTLVHKVTNSRRKDLMAMRKSSPTTTLTNGSNSIGIEKEKTETEMTSNDGVKKASLVEKDGNIQKLVLEEKTQNKVSSSKARLENGFFNCLKCHCLFGSLDIFYEHIKSSHICFDEPEDYGLYELYLQNKTDWWCVECNNEFVVKPSLLKHIQFQHADCHLGEINEYLDKIGYKKRVQDPLKEHQCHVCRVQLSNVDEFETHLRSHGQAYLQFVREKRKSLEVLHQQSNPNPNPAKADHETGTKGAGTVNKKNGNKIVRRNLVLEAY